MRYTESVLPDKEPALPPGLSRETTIRRDAEGRWYQDGIPLEHPNLVRAFDRWIERAEDGRYCLKNDINWAYVTIEGAPLFVRSIAIEPEGMRLRLSDEREELLDVETLRLGPDGALYCDARGGTMPARFDRHAMFQLEPVLGEDDGGLYIEVAGRRAHPPVALDPLARIEDGAALQ